MKDNHSLWIAVLLIALISAVSVFNQYSILSELGSLSRQIEASYGTQSQCYAQNSSGNIRLFSIVEKEIPIVAVSNTGEGIVGNLKIKLIPGNNNVLINTNPFLDTDIQYSVNKAVAVAKLRSGYDFDRDFLFDFKSGNARLIGGESAGAAITIATIAALQNADIKNDSVITGTINPDGTIGKVGGMLEKAKAVADAGYKHFLVPKGQSSVTYYEKQVTREPFGFGFEILNTRYVPKTMDLKETAKQEWGLDIIEISDIEEAIPYFLGQGE